MSTDAIKYLKDDESLTINLEKRNCVMGKETSREQQDVIDGDNVERVEAPNLGIAPKHIREYEIKKPEEKEPSLIKMISNKIRGNHQEVAIFVLTDDSSRDGSRENLANNNDKKLKEANNTNNVKGNK